MEPPGPARASAHISKGALEREVHTLGARERAPFRTMYVEETVMESIRRVVGAASGALAVSLALAAPASAQMAGGGDAGGGSLLWVWVWILVAGVAIFVAGTSLGVGKK